MSPQHPASSTTIHIDQPPSCLQFCPASPNNFVIGTYLLSETKTTKTDGSESIRQSKTGSLQLWQIHPEKDELSQISRYALDAAVFDLQFKDRGCTSSSISPSNIFAIATSDASVSLFTVSETEFTRLWTKTVHEDYSIPALYLAWLPEHWLSASESGSKPNEGFAVTFSDGRTGVFGLNEPVESTSAHDSVNEDGEGKATELATFEAKQPIEIWFVAAASYASGPGSDGACAYTPYLFTGNDFGSLHTRRFADARVGQNDGEAESNSPLSPIVSTDDKALHHTAGVTSIIPLPIPLSHPACNGAPLLLTGSYDECLRVYHASGRGKVLGEMGLGGGVWRLQILKANCMTQSVGETAGDDWTFLVLASCMHGGTRVVNVRIGCAGKEADIDILAEFTEHESMNYASDIWKARDVAAEGLENESELRVVSSSFYDRRVCVWRVTV